jgi:hypothetical protein
MLNSKVFGPLESDSLPHGVSAWLGKALANNKGCRFRLALEIAGGKRQKKFSAVRELESIAVDGEMSWKQGDYDFWFMSKKYFWKGKEIHLTAGEALFLYHVLVLREEYPRQAFYWGNMRRRLGKDFLAEIREEKGK